ncbi:hypothetical protein C8T65DRAFT_725870 [Cerioporus squamosus]|nr:hypothetical protein C8T65DRAFT_725870 [Cerioporus squamosus]
MSTTYEQAQISGSAVDGSDVRRELRLRLQHHRVSEAEQVLLWTLHLDARDEKTWESTAFQLWFKDHRPTAERDVHESQLAPLAIRGAARPGEGARGVPWQFAWTRAFRTVTQVFERVASEAAMHEIVTSEDDWAHRMGLPLLGLVWACVETAITGGEGGQAHIARLTVRLFDEFAKESPVLALVFGELLKRCVWEEFEAWWKLGGEWSLSSPAYRRNSQAMTLATSSIKFIGELYRLSMLPPDFIRHVVNLLCCGRWIALEQLRAVALLFTYMNASLRDSDPARLNNLKSAFEASCGRLTGSWMGEAYDRNEVVMFLKWYVDRVIRSWERPPSPLSREAFPGQPVIKLNVQGSIPSSPSYSSEWSTPSTSSYYLPPRQGSSSSLLYSSSPGSSHAVSAHPK